MNMVSETVIVFGATGRVGSVAARIAQEQGARVVLGMRDITKPIPGLTLEHEMEHGFQRVEADLSQPESVLNAVRQTMAKRAFIYHVFGDPDHMKPTLLALKAGGVDFVVYLSSGSIPDDVETNPSDSLITQVHWQVEVNLKEVFGVTGYLAVRAGYFASNTLWWSKLFTGSVLKLPYPEAAYDWVAPEDLSRVCGIALAKGSQCRSGFVRVYGPEVLTRREVALKIAKALGKDVTVTALQNDEACIKFQMENVLVTEPVARDMVGGFKSRVVPGERDSLYESPLHDEAVATVLKFSGQKATPFEEWAEKNKQAFS